MVARTINIAGFCSGIGMLELGAELALQERGFRPRPVVYCERETSTASALVAITQASGREAPVWDDLATFDGGAWRGLVDVATAGLPCPAFSVAGAKRGNADERAFGEDGQGPQAQFLRIVGEMRPTMVFLENVPPWVRGGHFERFGEQLSGLGYAIRDPLFLAAEDVGAPHRRERVFVLAVEHAANADGRCSTFGARATTPPVEGRAELAERTERGRGIGRQPSGGNGQPHGCDQELADGERQGRQGCAGGPRETGPDNGATRRSGAVVGDPENPNRRGRKPKSESAPGIGGRRSDGQCAGVPLFPPGRDDYGSWAAVAGVDPSRMPAIEFRVPVVADGATAPVANVDLLRIGGNGVVPLVAAVAFGVLFDEWIETTTRKPSETPLDTRENEA